jgi:hypothetical protein
MLHLKWNGSSFFLEQISTIDGILTEDGDTVALGARNVYINFNHYSSTAAQYDHDLVLETPIMVDLSTKKSSGKRFLFDWPKYKNNLPELACLLGCDYIDNIPFKSVSSFLSDSNGIFYKYLTASDKQQYINSIPGVPNGHFDHLTATVALF